MPDLVLPIAYWVHASLETKRARLHRYDCVFCNSGTGMARRPASPGGPVVWSQHATLSDARKFMSLLPYLDKADCKACMPLGAGWVEF
jgi:hypothetical protein